MRRALGLPRVQGRPLKKAEGEEGWQLIPSARHDHNYGQPPGGPSGRLRSVNPLRVRPLRLRPPASLGPSTLP